MNAAGNHEPTCPIDVVALVDEAKTARIKNYPCHVNRASQIGWPCLRYLVYSRTHWQEKRLHDVGLQRVFDLGNLYEQAVLKDFRDAGLYLEQQQSPFFDERYKLSGHIDGKLPVKGHSYPIEIKSMSPFTWDKIGHWRDFLRAKPPYLRAYPYQMTSYLFLKAEEIGLMFLKNKVSGALKQLEIPLDYDLAEEVLQKCEAINAHIEAKTLPDQIEWEDAVCSQCGFLHICYPGRDYGVGFQIVDDAEFEAMLDKRGNLAASAREYKELDETIKAAIKERPAILIGEWEITGKWVEKKGAKPYWLSKIIKKPAAQPPSAPLEGGEPGKPPPDTTAAPAIDSGADTTPPVQIGQMTMANIRGILADKGLDLAIYYEERDIREIDRVPLEELTEQDGQDIKAWLKEQ